MPLSLSAICTTCGTQYPPSSEPPHTCVICNDERQYVHPDGQSWTTLEGLRLERTYKNEILGEEDGLYSMTTRPSFAIGQTAYMAEKVSTLKFERLYNAFHRIVRDNASQSVQKSAERYIAALEGTLFDT
ncbi:hypothetical protein NZD89_10340 [Alicyclobacillus fastidiosus]|uniref:Hydrolase n=1 Tax=Alicyclobacillus fastidiosus TaxID=392011 RepID=A0ABY6ZLE7_9BACL|nr:hypothetical protein [Alicyclobacillus fastidiosus]WAH43744.1 hypothetical protein NZD89_10340 [Alicyclobacillus fastidiosus]GMA59959.1 hypothetical protein GCM10025859_03990 [Alicyclobacillus fastidiosus]